MPSWKELKRFCERDGWGQVLTCGVEKLLEKECMLVPVPAVHCQNTTPLKKKGRKNLLALSTLMISNFSIICLI